MNKKSLAAPETQKIDWADTHQRMEHALDALNQTDELTPQQRQAILKTRALALAQEAGQVVHATHTLTIIQFRLGPETYGIESAFVRETVPLKDFTPLPGVPAFVLGIVNVRGQILSIIDLKKCFNLPELGLGQLNKLIILRNENMEFGVLADEIEGSFSISNDSIQPVPPTISGLGAQFMHGVTADRVILLDAEKILSNQQLIVHQESI